MDTEWAKVSPVNELGFQFKNHTIIQIGQQTEVRYTYRMETVKLQLLSRSWRQTLVATLWTNDLV